MGFAPKDTGSGSLGEQVAKGGAFKYMSEGDHDVRVAGVDTNGLSDPRGPVITVKFVNDKEQEHNQLLYVTETDRKTGKVKWGWRFSQFLGALVPSPEAYEAFEAEANAGNADVFDMFIGMKLRIKLERDNREGKYGPAVEVEPGHFTVSDVKTGEVVGEGDTAGAADDDAKEKGYKKAYLRTTGFKATAGEANVLQFTYQMRALHAPKAPTGAFPLKKASGSDIPF